jgi:hypothetical protein
MTVIVPAANLAGSGAVNRVHVRPSQWTRTPATDFWYAERAAGVAANDLITDYGWTTTALSYTIGSAGDLLTSADVGTPTSTDFGAAADLLLSPSIFGDYLHAQMAADILGYAPTTLSLEAYAAFTTASAAETISGFGFSTGSGLTATNHVAHIYSDATNIAIRGTDGTGALTDTGVTIAALGATFHKFKIVATAGGTVEWFIDGASQGTITLKTDMFPTAFSASVTTTNRLSLAWAHVWYA